MVDLLTNIKEQLFDAPSEVKEAFNTVVGYFDNKITNTRKVYRSDKLYPEVHINGFKFPVKGDGTIGGFHIYSLQNWGDGKYRAVDSIITPENLDAKTAKFSDIEAAIKKHLKEHNSQEKIKNNPDAVGYIKDTCLVDDKTKYDKWKRDYEFPW